MFLIVSEISKTPTRQATGFRLSLWDDTPKTECTTMPASALFEK
jgi:hypothetical protein